MGTFTGVKSTGLNLIWKPIDSNKVAGQGIDGDTLPRTNGCKKHGQMHLAQLAAGEYESFLEQPRERFHNSLPQSLPECVLQIGKTVRSLALITFKRYRRCV